jgi:ABC-type proline/glycine betaine transport system substrate-binding protein
MDAFIKLLEVVAPFVRGGWQGLITLYVVWAVVKQFKSWQEKRDREARGLGHNPSAEVHDAIEDAVRPLREDVARLRSDVADVRDRVSRVEGHLDL